MEIMKKVGLLLLITLLMATLHNSSYEELAIVNPTITIQHSKSFTKFHNRKQLNIGVENSLSYCFKEKHCYYFQMCVFNGQLNKKHPNII